MKDRPGKAFSSEMLEAGGESGTWTRGLGKRRSFSNSSVTVVVVDWPVEFDAPMVKESVAGVPVVWV